MSWSSPEGKNSQGWLEVHPDSMGMVYLGFGSDEINCLCAQKVGEPCTWERWLVEMFEIWRYVVVSHAYVFWCLSSRSGQYTTGCDSGESTIVGYCPEMQVIALVHVMYTECDISVDGGHRDGAFCCKYVVMTYVCCLLMWIVFLVIVCRSVVCAAKLSVRLSPVASDEDLWGYEFRFDLNLCEEKPTRNLRPPKFSFSDI